MYKKIFFTSCILILFIGIIFYYRDEQQAENRADAALQSGYINYRNHKLHQAIGDFSYLADHYGDRKNVIIQQIVAKGLMKKADILTQLHDPASAILVYEQLNNLYMSQSNPKLRKDIAQAHFLEGNLLLQQKNYEAAMVPYSYLVSAYASDSSPDIQRMIAQVMHNETLILTATGHGDTALNIDAAIIERFLNTTDPDIQLVLAQSIMVRTKEHLNKKEWATALDNSNSFIKQFKENKSPIIQKYLIQNLLYRAEILHKDTNITKEERPIFGDNPQEAALKTYNEILAKIDSSGKDPDYSYYQALALLGKAQILANNHQTDEALTLCGQIYDHFHQETSPRIHEIVAGSLFTKGKIETSRQKLLQAKSTYDTLLSLYQPNTDPAQQNLNKTIISTYLNQSRILQKLFNDERAIQPLDKVIHLYQSTPDEALYYQLSGAILYKAELLTQMKKYEQALATYTGFIAVAHHKNFLHTRYNGATAILKKAHLLIMLHKGKEIGETFQQLTNFYLDDQNIEIRRVVAQGMYEHAQGLFENNRGYTAVNILHILFKHFDKNKDDPEIREILQKTEALKKQLDSSVVI